MLKRYKEAVTAVTKTIRCKDKTLISLTDMKAEDRLHLEILPKNLKWMLHYCTQTMPLSEDDKIKGGAEEGKVTEAQSFLLYQCLGQSTPGDCP